jgi:hypothetical protein
LDLFQAGASLLEEDVSEYQRGRRFLSKRKGPKEKRIKAKSKTSKL